MTEERIQKMVIVYSGRTQGTYGAQIRNFISQHFDLIDMSFLIGSNYTASPAKIRASANNYGNTNLKIIGYEEIGWGDADNSLYFYGGSLILAPYRVDRTPVIGAFWASANAAGTYAPLYYCSGTGWRLVNLT